MPLIDMTRAKDTRETLCCWRVFRILSFQSRGRFLGLAFLFLYGFLAFLARFLFLFLQIFGSFSREPTFLEFFFIGVYDGVVVVFVHLVESATYLL